jgi:cysteinyl-tRNA synthetase
MKLFNSKTKQIEEFKPLNEGKVLMYTCGPTVYNYTHIGNARTYTLSDFLVRTLILLGYEVKHVMNITDFGQIVGDADSGEDKMSVGLKREGLPRTLDGMKTLADKYSLALIEDINAMNFIKPDALPRATEYIETYKEMIQTLLDKKFAYITKDAIYFDTEKFPTYGQMALLDRVKKDAEESRINTGSEKKNSHDFALWKFVGSSADQESLVGFESPWGLGFPGWHIECSGMIKEFLGDSIDIHLGGIDLMTIHHVNEIAQSECANDCMFSQFFVHGEFININNQKMSKSLGNELTLRSIKDIGIESMHYRYFLLQTHYRQKCNFSEEALGASKNAYEKLQRQVEKLKLESENVVGKVDENYKNKFIDFVSNDLHIPKALALMWTLVKDKDVNSADKLETILYFNKVFGLIL